MSAGGHTWLHPITVRQQQEPGQPLCGSASSHAIQLTQRKVAWHLLEKMAVCMLTCGDVSAPERTVAVEKPDGADQTDPLCLPVMHRTD